jgi:acyl-CoA synthetase (AMP-forming)/AMP-acid ligase II
MASALSLPDKIASARRLAGDRQTPPPFACVGELFNRRLNEYGEKPFLLFFAEGTDTPIVFTYSSLAAEVYKTAQFLLSKGIVPGDRVATVAYNHADTVIHYFACWSIGAVVVPINTGEDDRRISFILRNSEAVLAFVRSEYADRIAGLHSGLPRLKQIVTVSAATPENEPDVQSAISGFSATAPPTSQFSSEHEALIVYTSGTTGNPKGVVLTHGNLLADAQAIAEWHRMTPDQRMMCVLPIHHVNGTVVTLLTPLWFGGSVVLHQKFHAKSFFRRIAENNVQVVSVVPTLLQFLLHENSDASAYDLTRLRHLICGAGPLTCDLAASFEKRFGIPVIHGYGLSETTCYSCFLPVDLLPAERERWLTAYGFPSIGVPVPANEMAIHDAEGKPVAEGVRGEIVIRGSNVMKEYFSSPEANEQAFANGWFRSGDEGFFKTDRSGRMFFFITGRLKELIIRGGVNISPFEIDEVLMNIPGVKAGLAVGFENDWYGEEIGAYIQLKEGATLSPEEIIAACRNRFPYQKCPKVVLFGNDIPATSTGKYQRKKLTDLFREWKCVQFTDGSRPHK